MIKRRFSYLALALSLGLVQTDALAAKHAHKKQCRHVSAKHRLCPKKTSEEVNLGHKMLVDSLREGYFGGTIITTSPYFGIETRGDGQELLVNLPSVNEDLRLLQQRRKQDAAFDALGRSPKNAIIELSGKLEGFMSTIKPYVGDRMSEIDLASADLSAGLLLHPWLTGLMAFAYDSGYNGMNPNRVAHSRVYLDKGFFTLGRLAQSPFYATLGQVIVPFGRYASFTPSGPLTRSLGKTKGRAFSLGYAPLGGENFSAQVYAMRGDSMEFQTAFGINNVGVNADLNLPLSWTHVQLGASYVGNITDSNGMQATGIIDPTGTQFSGFGKSFATEQLYRRVAGYDVRARIGNEYLFASAEWVGAANAFVAESLRHQGIGARPSAYHFEATGMFPLFNHPAALTVAHGGTDQALALNLPARRTTVALGALFFPNTITNIELRQDTDYAAGTTASGTGATTNITAVGGHKTALTAQFGVYW